MKVIKKIKIMHIVQCAGGVERYLRMLLKYMKNMECENILVCSQEYEEKNFLGLVDSCEIIHMIRDINPKVDFMSVVQVRKIIKKYNPDIIYMHSSKAGAIGRIANFGIDNITIYNPHGWAFNMDCNFTKKKLYEIIEKVLSPLCTEIVTISDFEKNSACKRRICSPKKINVVYNGIDFEEYNNLSSKRSSLKIPNDAFVIGMVGRLTKQKSPEIFIEAAEMIKKDIPNAFFVLVGSGELQSQIEVLIHKKGLDNSVLITGWVDNPIEYIYSFDLAMLLSRWEGFGLVLPEYMYAKKPVIATRTDAIPNIIKNGYNGLLVTVDEVFEIYEAAIKIITQTELRETLVNNARLDVEERFNFKRVADETYEMYKRLLENLSRN